ncbi:MAG: YqaA family protein [Pseudomonadota bacterium]
MIRALYDWTLALASHPRAVWALALVSFAESSVFPIPPDLMLIPMILAAPHRAFFLAFICTAASVAGAILGYGLGYFAFEAIGQPILEALGKGEAVAAFADRYNEHGLWIVLAAGVTPFPYKVITVLSGFNAMPLSVFIITSIIARGLRFFIVAGLLWQFGPPIRDFIEKRLGLMFTAFLVLLVGGFFLTGFL